MITSRNDLMMTKSTLLRVSIVALLAGSVLAACGKRGDLDPPPSATPAPKAEGAAPGQPGTKPKRAPITVPKRDLFIDRLLD
jgi:predicted small lipoprotein YifL